MRAKTVSLLGAATALAAGPAMAAPSFEGPTVPVAASYADLLTPIDNAQARLQSAVAEDAANPPELIQAQYRDHHHHHHHQHYYRWAHSRMWYLSHGYVWFGNRWMFRPRYHHHHHHHHHHE